MVSVMFLSVHFGRSQSLAASARRKSWEDPTSSELPSAVWELTPGEHGCVPPWEGWGGASLRWGLSGLSESPPHYGVLVFLFTSQLSSRVSKKSVIVIEGPRTGCPCLHGYQAYLFFFMGAHVHSISSVLAGIFLFYWSFKTSSAGAINFIPSPLSNVSISAFIFSHPFFHLPEAGVAL